MKQPILKVLLASSLLMLAACSDTVVTDYSDSKATAAVNFKVSDQISGATLDSVRITKLAIDSQAVVTDSLGYAGFKNVKIGEYLYSFKKTGYATVELQENVLDGQSNVPRVPDLNLSIQLAKLGAIVTGQAFYLDQNGNRIAVDSGTVQLTLGALGSFIWPTPTLTTTTDANGNYSFANLPEGILYTISVRQITVAGKSYSTTTPVTVSGVMAGETKAANSISMSIAGPALIVNSTNYSGTQLVSVTDNIIIKFSTTVDTTQIHQGDIRVTVGIAGNPEVLVTPTWSDNATTLTLTPVSSQASTVGKWWDGMVQTITLNLVSTNNIALTGFTADTFTPSSISSLPGEASNLKANYGDSAKPNSNTNSVTLKWNSATNAQGYAIFCQTPSDSSFIILDRTTSGTDTSITVTTTGFYNQGGNVSFVVVAYNSFGYAAISGAPGISTKDGIAPKVTQASLPGAIQPLLSALNNIGTTPDTLRNDAATIAFNEDMDTTTALALTPPAALSGKVSFYAVWTGVRMVSVIAIIAPSTDATLLTKESVSLDFSKITDLAGNAVVAPTPISSVITFN